jgi:hypothetical protein
MRLTDLNVRWIYWSDGTGPIAIEFDCPIHKEKHKIKVDFKNPMNNAKAVIRNNLWTREGEIFDNLSFTPSIDYTKYDNGVVRDSSCWHGFITKGEVI